MTRARWRLPSLPAGKSALLRGLLVSAVLFVLTLPIAPSGPEMLGNTLTLSAPSSLEPPMKPALSVCRTIVNLLSFGLHPFTAATTFSVLLTSLCCGVIVCWLRQLDVSRSVVIITALLLGLSPLMTELARNGGPIPLVLLLGLCLIVTTEQMRAEAGRGIGTCGFFAGMVIGAGPMTIPAIFYSFLSIVCDQNIRDIRWQALSRGFFGFLSGLTIFIATATFSEPEGLQGVLHGLISDWTPQSDLVISRAAFPFMLIAEGTGLLLGSLALIGILYGVSRRPGDLALLLTMASLGPLSSLFFQTPVIPTTQYRSSWEYDWIIFSVFCATLLASWSLTILHRRVGKSRHKAKQLLLVSMLILIAMSLAMRSPSLIKGKSALVNQWAQSVLNSLPQDALLITGGSPLGKALAIVQKHEGIRPDVIVLDRTGNLDPTAIGLAEDTSQERTSQAVRELVRADRSLVALPLALHHPLLMGRQLSPWGVVLIAHDPVTPSPNDDSAWLQIDISDLPVEPAGAWRWIRGEGPAPYASGSMATEVATASWFAIARKQEQLRGDGRWSQILGMLGQLLEDPKGTRRWALTQSENLVSSGATSQGLHISD